MDDHIDNVAAPGRYDAVVESEETARSIILGAYPDAMELPPAIAGWPYSSPPVGIKRWFQVHPAEPQVGHNLPHIKYVDWTKGKKGTGGSWGHLFFPPVTP